MPPELIGGGVVDGPTEWTLGICELTVGDIEVSKTVRRVVGFKICVRGFRELYGCVSW